MRFCGKSLLFVLVIAIAAVSVFLQVRYNNRISASCIFCGILEKRSLPSWLYEDEQLIAFKDIKPAATFHFLIIPKNHVANVYSLTAGEKQMLLDMKRIMLELLAQNNQTEISDISLGFHVPPFNSIQHLHLHGISPVSEIKFLRKLSFYENSFWYKTVDTVIESLR